MAAKERREEEPTDDGKAATTTGVPQVVDGVVVIVGGKPIKKIEESQVDQCPSCERDFRYHVKEKDGQCPHCDQFLAFDLEPRSVAPDGSAPKGQPGSKRLRLMPWRKRKAGDDEQGPHGDESVALDFEDDADAFTLEETLTVLPGDSVGRTDTPIDDVDVLELDNEIEFEAIEDVGEGDVAPPVFEEDAAALEIEEELSVVAEEADDETAADALVEAATIDFEDAGSDLELEETVALATADDALDEESERQVELGLEVDLAEAEEIEDEITVAHESDEPHDPLDLEEAPEAPDIDEPVPDDDEVMDVSPPAFHGTILEPLDPEEDLDGLPEFGVVEARPSAKKAGGD